MRWRHRRACGRTAAPAAATAAPHGAATSLLAIVKAAVQDLLDHPLNALGLGLVQLLVAIVLFVGMEAGALMAIFGTFRLARVLEDELVAVAGYGVTLSVLLFLSCLTGGLVQGWIAARVRRTWFPDLSTEPVRLTRVVLFNLVFVSIASGGMLLFVLPGIVALATLELALPAMMMQHPSWRLRFTLVAGLAMLLMAFVPVVGGLLVLPLYVLMTFRAYIACFGDGPAPRRIS